MPRKTTRQIQEPGERNERQYIYLTAYEKYTINQIAHQKKISTSFLIRNLIVQEMKKHPNLEIDFGKE